MRKILVALLAIILMAISSAATFLYSKEKFVLPCKVVLGFFSGEVAITEGNYIIEINKAKNFNDLMESTIRHKIDIIDIISNYLEILDIKNETIIDKSFLHMRLGFLYKNDGKNDMANAEFETALTMYNSTKEQPVDLKEMIYIYEKLDSEKYE
jgi:hypothetical protein